MVESEHSQPALRDSENSCSLHLACSDGNMELARHMISERADLNQKDRWGNEPLKYAMQGGHEEMINFLERAGAILSLESRIDLECTYCRCAAEGILDTMKTLLAAKVSVNSVDYDRRSALHLAASHGQIQAVEFLLANGVDISYQDRWSRNALDYAVQGGHDTVQADLRRAGLETSSELLSHGVKRGRASPVRMGALMWASMGNLAGCSKRGGEANTQRRNSLDSCELTAEPRPDGDARLELPGRSPKAARHLPTTGAAIDAHIRWGDDAPAATPAGPPRDGGGEPWAGGGRRRTGGAGWDSVHDARHGAAEWFSEETAGRAPGERRARSARERAVAGARAGARARSG